MPRVDVWIRKDDWDRWEKIKDKPLFLHNMLNVREAYVELPAKSKQQVKKYIKQMPVVINKPSDVLKTVKLSKDICPHGFSKSLRMCKKGCR